MINSILFRVRRISRTVGYSWILCPRRLLLPKIREEAHCYYGRQATFEESGVFRRGLRGQHQHTRSAVRETFGGLDFTRAERGKRDEKEEEEEEKEEEEKVREKKTRAEGRYGREKRNVGT